MRDVIEVTAGEVIAIDGKQLRRSYDTSPHQAAIHLVSAFLLKIHGISVKVEVYQHNLKGEPHGYTNCNRFLSL